MNLIKFSLIPFFLVISLIAQPSFSAHLSRHNEIASQLDEQDDHDACTFSKVALGSTFCTLCLLAAPISPLVSACSLGFVSALYYFSDQDSKTRREEQCQLLQLSPDTDSPVTDSPETEIIITNSPKLCQRIDNLSNPLLSFKRALFDNTIKGPGSQNIETLTSLLNDKGTLNGLFVDYRRIEQNVNAYLEVLVRRETDSANELKSEIEKLFRYFFGDDIINKRIFVFVVLSAKEFNALEEEALYCNQHDRALASFVGRLVKVFSDLEHGKGINAGGMSPVQIGTLKTEFELLSWLANVNSIANPSDEALVKLAEKSMQIKHVDRKKQISSAFKDSSTLDDVTDGILSLIRIQSEKDAQAYTSEGCKSSDIKFKVHNLKGFYRTTKFAGTSFQRNKNVFPAAGVRYEKQRFKTGFSENQATFYMQIWKNAQYDGEQVLNERNEEIFQALKDGRYKLVALAFGSDKSPNSTQRAFYLIPTSAQCPRQELDDQINEPIIYRLISHYNNIEEDPRVFGELLLEHYSY